MSVTFPNRNAYLTRQILKYPENPLLILDFRVLAWNIYKKLDDSLLEEELGTIKNWVKASWAVLINTGVGDLPIRDYTTVIVDDVKPYWRYDYLQKLNIEYKGGRPKKPENFNLITEIGLEYVQSPNSPFYYLAEKGFEADDWAGHFVKLKRIAQKYVELNDGEADEETLKIANRFILLHTIDCDWLQLVGNGVIWINTAHWQPTLRDYPEALQWAKKRMKVKIESPQGIIQAKVEKGDKSDNLPPGSPAEVIDLINPPEEHSLHQFDNRMFPILLDFETNNKLDHFKTSKDWVIYQGFPYVRGDN